MPSEIAFRPATRADALAYYGREPEATFRGYVAEQDGKIIGIGGVYYDLGFPVVFTEMKPEMCGAKKAIARATRLMIDYVDSLPYPTVYAVADTEYPTAPYLLAKLGFAPTGRMTERGELLVRRK